MAQPVKVRSSALADRLCVARRDAGASATSAAAAVRAVMHASRPGVDRHVSHHAAIRRSGRPNPFPEAGMMACLATFRTAPARNGETVMAPGDREWRVEAERVRDGIPLDPDTARFPGFEPERAGAAEDKQARR